MTLIILNGSAVNTNKKKCLSVKNMCLNFGKDPDLDRHQNGKSESGSA
jgi:hypothetical protein